MKPPHLIPPPLNPAYLCSTQKLDGLNHLRSWLIANKKYDVCSFLFNTEVDDDSVIEHIKYCFERSIVPTMGLQINLSGFFQKDVLPILKEFLAIENMEIVNNGLLSWAQAMHLGPIHCKTLLNTYGKILLISKLISTPEILTLYDTSQERYLGYTKLEAICTSFGMRTLQERLINIHDIQTLSLLTLNLILNKYGFIALKQKFLSIEQIKNINQQKLFYLLSEKGIFALDSRRITPQLAISLPLEGVIQHINSESHRKQFQFPESFGQYIQHFQY